jgi:hypothetical protein
MQRNLTALSDTPKFCQSSPAIPVNLGCISTSVRGGFQFEMAEDGGSALKTGSWIVALEDRRSERWRARRTDERCLE